MTNEEQIESIKKSTQKAKAILKKGDRIRFVRGTGIKRTYTFNHFDGVWIVSKSGIDDLIASRIDLLNGKPINFAE